MQTILSIGRESTNNIVLNETVISRKHAELIFNDNGKTLIKDLDSKNGTFVNGIRITEHYLQSNDIVKCANIPLNWKIYGHSNNVNPTSERKVQQNPEEQNFAKEPSKLQGSSSSSIANHSIFDNLPAMVKHELATLSPQKQEEFIEEYKRKSKSVGIAYLFLLLILAMHYGYLKKWGLQIVFWLTLGGFGIWWLIDLFRLSGLVRDFNKDVAVDIMRNLKIINN